MNKIMRFNEYEKFSGNPLNEDGFGNEDFVRIKKGSDVYIYIFKIEDETQHTGYAVQFGKFSSATVIEDAKANYAVLTAVHLSEAEAEQAVLDQEAFEMTEGGKITAKGPTLERFIKAITACATDYLTNLQPKVFRVYDELPSIVEDPSYTATMDEEVTNWPNHWDLQQMEAGRLNVISKTTV